MEDLYYLYLGLALVSLLVVIAQRRRGPAHGHDPRLPPGPWQLPIIGSMHHLAGQLPHRAMRDLARLHGPVMLLRIGEVPTLVVSSREAAREVMKTHDTAFASRPLSATTRVLTAGGRDIIFAPGDWAWLRLHHRTAAGITDSSAAKLAPRFYGPYQVLERVGPVAYRLQLPARAKIHNVFHVVFLKRFTGDAPAAVVPLPPIVHGRVVPAPLALNNQIMWITIPCLI